jgi:predicted acyl esterase
MSLLARHAISARFMSARWALVGSACAMCLLSFAAGSADAASDRVRPLAITAADGTVLRGHVHLPDGRRPFATVLDLSPYWNNVYWSGGPGVDSAAVPLSDKVRPLLEAGFAVALVNMRGTGVSDGCLQFGGRTDWTDARTVVEALAHQPWSNGRIGMYGLSYEGWSQWMAVAARAPSLKAVVPMSGVIDPWSLLTRQGAPIVGGPAVADLWTARTTNLVSDPNAGSAACREIAPHTAAGADLVATGDRTDYFQSRDERPFLAGSRVPALVSNGLKYATEGHLLQFDGLWDLLEPRRTRFVLGQWEHASPADKRADWWPMAIAWLDHYLRGGPKTVQTGQVEYQDDSGEWHTADRWPPRGGSATIHLDAGRLDEGAAAAPAAQTFQSHPTAEPGTETGPYQATYVSAPLRDDVLLAGNFTLSTTVTSTLPGGNLVAVLRQGVGSSETLGPEIARVQLDLGHWLNTGHSRPFPVLAPTPITARSTPFASRVPKGRRLILSIGGGSAELQPDQLQPALTVTTGPGVAGSIELPLVEGRLGFQATG